MKPIRVNPLPWSVKVSDSEKDLLKHIRVTDTFLRAFSGGAESGMNHTDALNILQKLKEKHGTFVHGANFSKCLERVHFGRGHGGEDLLEFYLKEGANPDTRYTYRNER